MHPALVARARPRAVSLLDRHRRCVRTTRFELLKQGAGEAALHAFDLLRLDGDDLRERPLEQRRDLLRSLLSNTTAHCSNVGGRSRAGHRLQACSGDANSIPWRICR